MGASDKVQAFTAIGRVRPGEVYQVRRREGFAPHRRDVAYADAREASIAPLLGKLSFPRDGANWGMVMRRGAFEITEADFHTIARAMGVDAQRVGTGVSPR